MVLFSEDHIQETKRRGRIEVICGSMFSGKTEELIRRLKRAKFAKQRVEIFKPAIDTRYSEADVVSHDSHSIASTPIDSSASILLFTSEIDVVGIDEAQFFDSGLIDVCNQLANNGIRVIVAGLDMDFRGIPFGPMPGLCAIAIRILKEVDLILAEDTRTSGILLKHFEIKNAMQSHHKFNEHKTVESVVNRIKGGETVALISDAGTPGISDPGFLVVRECVRNGIEVQCLPGATAFVPALVASGLPNEKFCFEGFLPQKKGRMTRLKALAEECRTMVFYESPHRLVKALTQFAEHFGAERQASVSREISKMHEETVRGTLTELIEHFTANEPRGEIVIVVTGIDD